MGKRIWLGVPEFVRIVRIGVARDSDPRSSDLWESTDLDPLPPHNHFTRFQRRHGAMNPRHAHQAFRRSGGEVGDALH